MEKGGTVLFGPVSLAVMSLKQENMRIFLPIFCCLTNTQRRKRNTVQAYCEGNTPDDIRVCVYLKRVYL